MLVFSNQRLGPAAELMVSREIAANVLTSIADAARPIASAHWERELVRWLDDQAVRVSTTNAVELAVDVGDIAFTPQHFDRQRRFLIDAITRAGERCEHSRALVAWAAMIEAHPRESIQFGRRWVWHSTV